MAQAQIHGIASRLPVPHPLSIIGISELPICKGSTQFEFKFACDTNLQIYISRSHIYSGRTLEFISAQHKRIQHGDLYSNCVLPVPIGSLRNSNFEADVLETHSSWALLPMIFVISIFELTKRPGPLKKLKNKLNRFTCKFFQIISGLKSPNSPSTIGKRGVKFFRRGGVRSPLKDPP